jgi:branched-chain amino acid transport system ATP-binding protein
MMQVPRLSLRDVSVRYGGVRAVDQVSFDVQPGSIVGLIGPNGAGKTSLLDAITGFTKSTGDVLLDGDHIESVSAFRRARLGVGRTFQSGELFEDLTVLENVIVGSYVGSLKGSIREILRLRQRPPAPLVELVLEQLGITHLASRLVDDLSTGHRRLVAVARTLAADPKIIMLDEPAAGLDSSESAAFGSVLRQIAADGHTVLLVDHDMNLVLGVSDRVEVLDFGVSIASDVPAEIRTNPDVLRAYLAQDEEAPHG